MLAPPNAAVNSRRNNYWRLIIRGIDMEAVKYRIAHKEVVMVTDDRAPGASADRVRG